MKKKKLRNIHPGEILNADFLDEMLITPYALARAILSVIDLHQAR